MKKTSRAFKLIACVCAVALLACSLNILTPLAAKNESPYTYGEAVFDFEDGNSFLDFALHYNTFEVDFDKDDVIDGAFAKVMTENEGTETENKFLRLQNQTYKNLVLNFPFELKNGATYNISFKIRDDGSSHLGQVEGKESGIYVGKSTGQTVLSKNAQLNTSQYLGTKLSTLYGTDAGYVKIDKASFTTVSHTFTVGESDVDDAFKYLAFNYYCRERNGSAYEYIDIDDIHIQKISDSSAVYNFDDTNNYLDYGIEYNQNDASVTVETEENGNRWLKLNNSAWQHIMVTFPFELENSATYIINYDICGDGSSNVFQSSTGGSGIYIGKSTNTTNKISVATYLGTKLSNLYAEDTYSKLNSTAWIHQSRVFTVGESAVDSDFKYLTIDYMDGGSGYNYIGIDNITITKLPSASYANGFEDGAIDFYSTKAVHPVLTADPANSGNQVISILAGNYTSSSFTLPVELTAGETYTFSFKYKTNYTSALALNSSSVFGISDINGGFTTKFAYFKSDQELDDGNTETEYNYNWNPNKISNTDWLTRTYTFTADETNITDTAKYFTLFVQPVYSGTDSIYIYLDDIKLITNPVLTFNSNGGSEVSAIRPVPGNTATVQIPVKDGYDFAGWYLDSALTEYAGYTEITAPENDTVYYAKWESKVAAGDADNDGSVSANDLTALRRYLLTSTDNSALLLPTADCNGDGTINILDLIRLKKYIADPENTVLGITINDASLSGYSLVWNDEFEGTALDSAKWTTSPVSYSNDETTFADDSEHLFVNDGALTMRLTQTDDGIYQIPYAIVTHDTMNFKHGYLEVRAKMPYYGQGEWSAIWMLTSRANIAKNLTDYDATLGNMEIDVAENMSQADGFASQLHKYPADGSKINNVFGNTDNSTTVTNTADWHTYGIYWSETELKFYCDGEMFYSYTIPAEDSAMLNQYTSLLLSSTFFTDTFCAGNEWAASQADTNNYFENNENLDFAIDYVRLYQNTDCGMLIAK